MKVIDLELLDKVSLIAKESGRLGGAMEERRKLALKSGEREEDKP